MNVFELKVNDIVYRYENNVVVAYKVKEILIEYGQKLGYMCGAYDYCYNFSISAISSQTGKLVTHIDINASNSRYSNYGDSKIGMRVDKSTGVIYDWVYIPKTYDVSSRTLPLLEALKQNYGGVLKDTFGEYFFGNELVGSGREYYIGNYYYVWKNNCTKRVRHDKYRWSITRSADGDRMKKIYSGGYVPGKHYLSAESCQAANEIKIYDFDEPEQQEFSVNITRTEKSTITIKATSQEEAIRIAKQRYLECDDEINESLMCNGTMEFN